ncbi:heterokaryon incompatibility protein-domain-containing protein [Paraphoma chrysanthemicola]|uniref:Heterokaryon incompatibility protein-domain-containing protein n=1 Tax=Paraphoma chrysanthemicola TaxID=798071 RepID=A0A8K0W3I2_9PLEO|nr:heterokaryon incompatibility protein-domain-containing protein [Paraphoma chrysanthemicola]
MPYDNHRYHALTAERREIRLLTLSPGEREEPIKCSLSTVSLTAEPNYDALSYVWGKHEDQSPTIELDGSKFTVTLNLFSALRHIREPAGKDCMTLWVDAVCINQNDIDERNAQVSMMRDIYASAARVIIWLGEEDDDSETTFDALSVVANEGSWFWQDTSRNNESRRQAIFYHCGNFFFTLADRRAWFSRVWILQELAMARTDPIVVCGWQRASWATFVAAWQMIADDFLSAMGTRRKTSSTATSESNSIEKPERLSLMKVDLLNSLRQSVQLQGGMKLTKLLMSSYTSEATDPRDRIYGLLGLLELEAKDPSKCFSIPVDYRKSSAEVYADAMAHIFSRGEGPDFLSGLFMPGSSATVSEGSSISASRSRSLLPSWVPDFSRQVAHKAAQTSSMLFLPPPGMSASGAGQGAHNGKVLSGDLELQVEGLMVDTIHEIIPLGSSLHAIIHQLAHLEAATIEARERPCNFDSAIASHMQQFRSSEPLWRILVSNKRGYEAAPISYQDTYLSFLNRSGDAYDDFINSKHLDDLDKPPFEISLRFCVDNKSLFTTKNGFVGTCVPTSCPGDAIAIIFGSPTPFVLRPIRSLDGEKSTYSLVGGSYVGGIMGGEMVDELYCEDLMDSTTFFIR